MTSRGSSDSRCGTKSGTGGMPFQAIVMSCARTPRSTSSDRVTSLTVM